MDDEIQQKELVEITKAEWDKWMLFLSYAKMPTMTTATDEGDDDRRVVSLKFDRAIKVRIYTNEKATASQQQMGEIPQRLIEVNRVTIGSGGLLIHYKHGHHSFDQTCKMDDVISVEQTL